MGVITVLAVFFLILVGGIVRSTGSGMGCPDWPRCFGQWVPPTHVGELPADYKTRFMIQGKEIADFSALKTWTEYVNRLVGVAIGLLIFATLVLSTSYWNRDRVVFWGSLATFLLVGFQGWLGSVVVSTDLHPVLITAHMLLAQVIVCLLIYLVARSYQPVLSLPALPGRKRLNGWLLLAMTLTLLQVVLGTQVREAVDLVARELGEYGRPYWIGQLGLPFYIHRSFSIALLGANGYLIWMLLQQVPAGHLLRNLAILLAGLLLSAVITGIGMAYLGMPAFLQPVHLLLGSLLLGLQFLMGLLLNPHRAQQPANALVR